MTTINIIGAGRVGRTFLRLFGPQVRDVASRSRASAESAVAEAGYGRARDPADMGPADLWFLTVPDTEITTAARALSEVQTPPAIAVHFSGFHSADVMAPLRSKGWHLASAHPNLSFADPVTAAASFSGTPCGVEGDAQALKRVDAVLREVGALTFNIGSDQKALYHAAAVFSNNFTTVLQAIARDAWAEAGVPDEIATKLNASLLNATAKNVAHHGPAAALTGPAARGDMAVVKAQGETVARWNGEVGTLYQTLSALAVRLKATGKI